MGSGPSPTTYDANHIYNKQTLGFRVDTRDEIRAEKDSWRLPPAQIDDFMDYIKVLVGFMGDMANKMHLHYLIKSSLNPASAGPRAWKERNLHAGLVSEGRLRLTSPDFCR